MCWRTIAGESAPLVLSPVVCVLCGADSRLQRSFTIPAITLDADGRETEKGAVRIYTELVKMLKEGMLTVPRLAAGAKSFRTSCERSGKHDFSSQEVEYEAGGALQEFYGTKCKMKKPEVTVRVCVTGEMVVVGTQLHEDDLAKRRKYKFVNRVTLKSNLAACMLRKANLLEPRPGARLLDMFCGSGTVLLEWVDSIRHSENSQPRGEIEAVGIDVSLGAVQGARANAEAEGASSDCSFIKCDAKAMRAQLDDGTFDAIVTNVPWGVQTGNDAKVDLEKLYEMVLRNSWHLLRPQGRIVMLVLRGLQVLQILRRLSFRFKILE
jgi:tRNA G10  N-methylase Trm11